MLKLFIKPFICLFIYFLSLFPVYIVDKWKVQKEKISLFIYSFIQPVFFPVYIADELNIPREKLDLYI